MKKLTIREAERQKKIWQGTIMALVILLIGSIYLFNVPYSLMSKPDVSVFGTMFQKQITTYILLVWSGIMVGLIEISQERKQLISILWLIGTIFVFTAFMGSKYLEISSNGFAVKAWGHLEREYRLNTGKLLFARRVKVTCVRGRYGTVSNACTETVAVGGQGPVFTLDPCYGQEALYLIKLRFGDGIRLPDEETCAPRFYY